MRAAIIGGAYSLLIEIGQRFFDGYEPLVESMLDVACGALGGWLAMVADERLRHRHHRIEPAQSASARLR